MGKIYFLILLVIFTAKISAQEFAWSKKKSNPNYLETKGIITDNTGNIYDYGSRSFYYHYWNYNLGLDTSGSFLYKYSPSGDLISTKRWQIPFHLAKLIYDDTGSFYFTGIFSGTQIVNGISIVSQGDEDAVIGKMDLTGNVLWMNTFGGPGKDVALDLCFNSAKNALVVTGSIADTLYIDNNFKTIVQPSLILSSFNLSGTNINYKLYDFLPQRTERSNCGIEITSDNAGNYFLLADREGMHWNGDTITAPPQGRYVMKLNSNLDTLWATYIIGPGCYYGWSCSNLRSSTSGDVYITSRCSYKYGGTAYLERLNGASGNTIWYNTNNDGYYNDVLIDSNTVYLIGNEGANHCPCPGSHSGHYVVKIIDQNNQTTGETRVQDSYFEKITKDNYGSIFISGTFRNREAIIAGDTIVADSTISYGTSYSYAGRFLSKLNDKNCTPLEITSTAMPYYGKSNIFCPAATVTMTASAGLSNYQWSHGGNSQISYTSLPGLYYVSAVNASGCKSYSLPFSLFNLDNSYKPSIFYPGVDTSINKKVLYFSSYIYNPKNYYFKIYKEDNNGFMQFHDTVSFPNYSSYYPQPYIDYSSSGEEPNRKYTITLMDSCGTESPVSDIYSPIYLSIKRSNGKNILDWTRYKGRGETSYEIYRGVSKATMTVIATLDSLNTYYEDDYTGQPGVYFYLVRMKINYYSNDISFSNIVQDDLLTGAPEIELASVKVSPNPFENHLKINLQSGQKFQIVIKDVLGREVKNISTSRSEETLDLTAVLKGIYFLTVVNENNSEKHFTIIKH